LCSRIRPGDSAQIEAAVRVEIAILGREERLRHLLRHFGKAHGRAVVVVRGVDAADGQRLQVRERQQHVNRLGLPGSTAADV